MLGADHTEASTGNLSTPLYREPQSKGCAFAKYIPLPDVIPLGFNPWQIPSEDYFYGETNEKVSP